MFSILAFRNLYILLVDPSTEKEMELEACYPFFNDTGLVHGALQIHDSGSD